VEGWVRVFEDTQGGSMAIGLDPKQVVSFEELLISQAVSQDALIRLLIEKGIFTQEEFLEMVKKVDQERKRSNVNKQDG
jgi:hypothetical protein